MSVKIKKHHFSRHFESLSCCNCNVQFFVRDLNLRDSKCPFLLQCGHSLCDMCQQQGGKTSKAITCKQCGSISTPEHAQESLPVNLYSLGCLVAVSNFKQENDKRLSFLKSNDPDFDYAPKDPLKCSKTSAICEECTSSAQWFCENCKSNFCERCWIKVHASARSLMKHMKVLCSKQISKTALRPCPDHESQNLEFFCKGCQVAICPHCIILSHQGEGHSPITLKDKNLEVLEDAKSVANDAEVICKRMKQTLEKIKTSFNTSRLRRQVPSDLETKISSAFARLHGILQLEEVRLLKNLENYINSREVCLRKLHGQLESQIGNVDNLLEEFQALVKAPNSGDMTDLHEKLKEACNLPCYLVSSESSAVQVPRLSFDDSLIDLIRNYCTLNVSTEEEFQLKSTQGLPKDYVIEELAPELPNPVPTRMEWYLEQNDSEIDSVSVSSSKDLHSSELNYSIKQNSVEFFQKPITFVENKVYSVRLTFIVNPGEFYVTLNSQIGKQRFIDKRAWQAAERSHVIPDCIDKDDIYLVKYTGDERWYRARVVRLCPEKKGPEDQVEVYYFDYGNSEVVSKSRLRPIPMELLEEPPLAVKCKLFDCTPKNGEWCCESRNIMRSILENSTASMFVMKVHSDVLEVDLSKISSQNQIGSDIVSVRDALVFLELVNLVGGGQKCVPLRSLKYPCQGLPVSGEIFDVLVTHVNSPWDFYIQKFRLSESFAHLSIELQRYCENSTQKGVIYNPVVGMPCAAIFPEDQKWYRAIIEDIPGKKMITVFYVDYGNRETVPWTCVKKIKDFFLKTPPMAFRCTLNDDKNMDPLFWDPQVVAYMKKNLEQKKCRVKVVGRINAKKKIKVLLYQKLGKKIVCMNVALVEMNCARRGQTSNFDETKPEDCEIIEVLSTRTLYESTTEVEIADEKSTEEIIVLSPLRVGKQNKSKPTARESRNQHPACEGSTGSDAGSDRTESSLQGDIFKVKVEVLSAESPSLIYVTLPALKAVLMNLQEKLAKYYEDSTPDEDIEWAPDSKCAVYSASRKSWYRATVLETLPDGKAKVFLKDIATISTEPLSSLRILNQAFFKYGTCAIKCHLSGVRPAGEEWPSITCEFLSNELSEYDDVYMTKTVEIENQSLPIELWVQRIVPGTALEPTVKEWVTINKLLVDQGLAIPVKTYDLDLVLRKRTRGVRSSFECLGDGYFSGNDRKVGDADMDTCENNESDSEGLKTSKRRKKEGLGEEEEEERTGDESYIPPLSFKWLPATPLKQSRFVGMPTYVDYSACIYLHDIEAEETLKQIRKTLVEEFENSSAAPEDHFWSPGQACVVRYHVDNLWYRGLVLQANEDLTYSVLFIDYGNVEICQAVEMRKRIKTADVPIQTHKFQLRGIVPTATERGLWPISVIDFLHLSVVEKYCQVVVWSEPRDPEEYPSISLKRLEDDVDVGTLLIEQKMAEYNEPVSSESGSSKGDEVVELVEVASDDQPCQPSNSSNSEEVSVNNELLPLVIPSDFSSFSIKVTTIISENEFFGNLVKDNLPSELDLCLRNFETLQEGMAGRCETEAYLQNFDLGRPCCIFYSDDGTWKRAQIESYDQSTESASVLCVDCGNKYYLKTNQLRECPIEWLNIPKMAVKFRLADVEKCPDISKSAVVTALTDLLKGHEFFVEVVENSNELLKVRLMTEKDGPLAYQKMIDDGLLKFAE